MESWLRFALILLVLAVVSGRRRLYRANTNNYDLRASKKGVGYQVHVLYRHNETEPESDARVRVTMSSQVHPVQTESTGHQHQGWLRLGSRYQYSS